MLTYVIMFLLSRFTVCFQPEYVFADAVTSNIIDRNIKLCVQ